MLFTTRPPDNRILLEELSELGPVERDKRRWLKRRHSRRERLIVQYGRPPDHRPGTELVYDHFLAVAAPHLDRDPSLRDQVQGRGDLVLLNHLRARLVLLHRGDIGHLFEFSFAQVGEDLGVAKKRNINHLNPPFLNNYA